MGEDSAPHPHRWAMLAGVWMVYFCFGSTAAAIAPLVARITTELDLNHTQMGSILGAWQLVYIGAAIPCGALLDRIGPRPALRSARSLSRSRASCAASPRITSPCSSIGLALAGGDWRLVLIGYGFVALAAAVVWFAIGSHEASRAQERRRHAEKPAPSSAQYLALLRAPAMRTVLYLAVGTFFFGHALNNWLPEILRFGGMDPTSAGLWASIPVVIGMIGALIFPRLAIPERRMKILAALFLAQLLAPLFIEWGGSTLIAGLVFQGLARGSSRSSSCW